MRNLLAQQAPLEKDSDNMIVSLRRISNDERIAEQSRSRQRLEGAAVSFGRLGSAVPDLCRSLKKPCGTSRAARVEYNRHET